jgi:pimeloyl-ACP methyl ester carboxylesterase
MVSVKYALAVTLAVALGTACNRPRRAEAEARPPVTSEVRLTSAELTRTRSGTLETVDVQGDKDVLVLVGENTKRPIVYLHGMCSDARSDLESWGNDVSAHGTIIALSGDAACPRQNGKTTWTTDVLAIDARIGAAVEAVHFHRGVDFDPAAIVLVGESMGAARALSLASEFPAKYTRLVLVGSPEAPRPRALGSANGVALLAGELERQDLMEGGAKTLSNAGVRARYWELPGARHGTYGPSGGPLMSEAIGFVVAAR